MHWTILLRMGVQPEAHRYAQATFHDGTHRQAPGDSTPWRDVASPLNRVKGWWLAPAAKGSLIGAWCIAIVFGAYCFSIQQDAKGTYLLNNVLLRTLHEETLRADANEERTRELQDSMKRHILQEERAKSGTEKVIKQYEEFSERVKKGLVNYELELSRERARADVVHDRNQELVGELLNLRQEMAEMKKEKGKLLMELEKAQKILRSVA